MHAVRSGTDDTDDPRSSRNRGRRRPPARPGRPSRRGTLVNLAETIVIKEENVFAVCRRDGSLPVGRRTRSASTPTTAASSPATSCASTASGRGCSSPPRRAGSESVHELTNPALPLPGGRVLPLQSIQLRLERRVAGECELEETLLVHSYDREPLELELDLLLAADFEPMLAIRGIVEAGGGAGVAVERLERGVRFSVRGRDGRHRATTVVADRACEQGDARGLAALPALAAAGRRGDDHAALRSCTRATSRRRRPAPRQATRRARRTPEEWLHERTTVVTDDELFNRVLRRSLLDMRMLHSRLGGDGYYAAGVPWYATLFGRDSLIAATQMLAFDPPMAAQTLRVLAGLIGDARRPGATTRSPARCCTSCARARSRGSASPRSPATTAPSTRRRCSSACCASTPTGAATCRCSASCAARSTRCSAGSTARATATATACSSTRSGPRPGCATRAGRTPTRACSTSTARRWSRRSR